MTHLPPKGHRCVMSPKFGYVCKRPSQHYGPCALVPKWWMRPLLRFKA